MKISMDIKPVTYLKSQAAEILKQVNETHRPIVITQNGEPKAVLQDPESYENMRNAIGILKLISQAEEDIRNEIKLLGITDNVKMIGYLDQMDELPACYSAADIFVFSSKSETQGIVLLEAMAQGTPVVAIAELGTASILFEGRGALIAKDDTKHFSGRVDELLSDQGLHQRMSEEAFKYAKRNWSAKDQAKKLISFYSSVKKRYGEKKNN